MTYPTFDPDFPARAVKALAEQADREALELAADLLSTSTYGYTLHGIVNAHSAIASLSTSTTNSISGVALNVSSLSTVVSDNYNSVNTELSTTNSAVASLSTSTSMVVDTANTALTQLNNEIVNTNNSLNTQLSITNSTLQSGLSNVRSQVASLSTSTSSGLSSTLSNARSSVASLSTSVSTGLSTAQRGITSLSTIIPRQFGTPYTKMWNGMVTTSTATAVFDISSAGFTNIVGIYPSAFLNGATVLNAPIPSIVARSNTSITIRLVQSKTTNTLLISSVEGLENHAAAATAVYLMVTGN